MHRDHHEGTKNTRAFAILVPSGEIDSMGFAALSPSYVLML